MSYAVLFFILCACARADVRSVQLSMLAATCAAYVAGVYLLAQMLFQISVASMDDQPGGWLRIWGLSRLSSNPSEARMLVPDILVLLTSVWCRKTLGVWVHTLSSVSKDDIRPAVVANLGKQALMRVFSMSERSLNDVIPKWFRLGGFVCSVGMGYSANGIMQLMLFISAHMRLFDLRHSKTKYPLLTKVLHYSSKTTSLQILTAIIICGSYFYTAVSNTSQEVESSNTGAILGFWSLGTDGSMCCMSTAKVVGLTFAFLSHLFFAMANATGDTGEPFTFRELMGFDIKHQMSLPLYYLPLAGVFITFTGLTNTPGLQTSFVQIIDVLSVLFMVVWMLASARGVKGIRRMSSQDQGTHAEANTKSYEEKWLHRSSKALYFYVLFQYCYIAALYVYNIPDVASSIQSKWPDALRRHLTPYDFGMFRSSALESWEFLYPRYLTTMFCVVLSYWLAERSSVISSLHIPGSPRRLDLDASLTTPQDQNAIGFALDAISSVMTHVRTSIGEKVEESVFEVSMEMLLLVATMCVGFRIELLSVIYAIVIVTACMELAVPSIRGTNHTSLRHGSFKIIGACQKLLQDVVLWIFYGVFRRRRSQGNIITAESVANTPTRSSITQRDSLTESDYKVDPKQVPVCLHSEVNDYGFVFVILACTSITLKILTQITFFQSGSLSALVNVKYGSWLGLLSFSDSRLEDVIQSTSICCPWPYKLDVTQSFCYDESEISSSSNEYSTQACFGFQSNWYILGVHYAVIIFAVFHGFLQRRHNVRMLMKAKSFSAKATPRASYWAKLRGDVKGCDVAMKLKLLIAMQRDRAKEPSTPVQKRVFASTDPGMSPIVQATPTNAEEDVFKSVPWAKATSLKGKNMKKSWRVLTLRLVYRFVSWDLSRSFNRLDSVFEQLASLKYLLAMVVLLINAFLKSDVTSTVYIIILGYFLAFNNGEGIVRCQSQGYAILLVIGFILMIHVVTALRLPTTLLDSNYCESCPEKHFWLDIWGCPASSTPPPPPPPPPPGALSNFDFSCSSRPVIVQQYEVVSDIIVMLLIGHYVRKGHKNHVRDDVRTAWMRGYMRFKGQVMGEGWVQSEAFTRLANRVNARLAERRKLDETSELSFNEKIKRWDAVAKQLEEYKPSAIKESRREETKRAAILNRRLSRQVTSEKERSVVNENLSFEQIVLQAKDAAAQDANSSGNNAHFTNSGFLKFFYKYLLVAIMILTMVAAVTQVDSDFISLAYASIAIMFALNYDGLRINCRIFRNRGYKWWNCELFRVLSTYVYFVLAAKLVYQIPYIKPILLNGHVALDGTCVEGTSECETINSLFGLRKLGSACDASMFASDCGSVLSWRSGSIGIDILLFLLCSIQVQLHSSEAYVRAVLKFEKQAMDRRARRSALYRKYIVSWRAKINNSLFLEYQSITEKVRASAMKAHEWSEFQKFRRIWDEEESILHSTPQNVKAVVVSSTSVRVKWKIDKLAKDIEAFYIKRERAPRASILPQYVNPVRVEVDPESSSNSYEYVVDKLTPGVNYTFVIQSYSQSNGFGPSSHCSEVVSLPKSQSDDAVVDAPTKADKALSFMSRLSGTIANVASYLLDPALYPLPDDADWISRGDWGDSGLISGLGKVLYSQSERIFYIALVWNFVDHMDLMTSALILFVLCFASLMNPQPTPAAWRIIFWYAVVMLYVRLIIRSKVFCMQLDSDASADDRNRWHISIQPFCPTSTLYDATSDSEYSTASATLLTVPRNRTLVRDEVMSDIFLIASLVLHITHMTSLGQCTIDDADLVKPREDYEKFHELHDISQERMTSQIMSRTMTKRKDEALIKRKSRRHGSFRKSNRPNILVRCIRHVVTNVSALYAQVGLQNSRRTPTRDVGKPGTDVYALEILLQFILTLWFITDYSALVFESVTGLSSTESFGTGLTISIISSVAWVVLTRIVYLTQRIRVKFALHLTQCVLYVVGVFLIVPLVDTRAYVSPRHNSHLRGFTVVMLLQFCLGAMQIREGYREGSQHKILLMRLGNSPPGRTIFRLTNLVPFLFEIRTMLDWVVCNTSMDFVMWFRYETLYYLLHVTHTVHSWRKNKREIYGGAIPFPYFMKILQGVGIILGILALLTAPVFIFSTFNPALASNRVSTGTMEVHLDFSTQRHVLYYGIATGFAMDNSDDSVMQMELIGRQYYQSADSDCIRFPKFSASAWILPPTNKAELATALSSAATTSSCDATVTISTSFTRAGPSNAQTLTYDFVSTLTDAKCSELAAVISADTGSVQFDTLIPRGLHLPPSSSVEIIDRTYSSYIGLNMTLGSTTESKLWSASPSSTSFPDVAPEFCGTDVSESVYDEGVLFAAVSDRFLVGLVSSLGLSSYSVRALYFFIFFTVGYIIRSFFSFKLMHVLISEMSNTEEVMNVCQGLRLIRSLDYPGRRRDELKMYHALMRMTRASSMRRSSSIED